MHRAQREGEDAPSVYVLAGSVEDRHMLQYSPQLGRQGSSAATDLSRFAWRYGRTDRERPTISCHVADTHALDAVAALLSAWECMDSGLDVNGLPRLVYHTRPQALVFDAETRGVDEAQEWIAQLVERGVGQPVEDLRVPCSSGTWQRRVACTRCMKELMLEDVLEINGWAGHSYSRAGDG